MRSPRITRGMIEGSGFGLLGRSNMMIIEDTPMQPKTSERRLDGVDEIRVF